MHRLTSRALAVSLSIATLVLGASMHARADDGGLPDIPCTKRVLKNGLRLVVHEDHNAPVVAVNVWYHVGSKNERAGRTGFAHLFEHLMFNGSEHANDDWFRPINAMGATSVNGTTNEDRTNYFETVPTGALDATLWLESDRMGHLLGAIDQAKLDEQRGVVQNEKRQGENQPYSATERLLPSLLYPAGHPYSWSVIGSMEDLDAASLDDVKEWFRSYYGAANALVVICGDVKTEEVVEKVERYFGDIPAGPPVARPEVWIAKRNETKRVTIDERVPAGRVHQVWNSPQWGSADSHLLELAAAVLGRGDGSRLYERLVRKDALATDVWVSQEDSEIGGQFHVSATAARGADLAKLEAAVNEELARFLAEGPTEDELATEKAQMRAQFLRRIERVGGFGGKSGVLASSELFGGRPDAWKDRLTTIAGAIPAAVRIAASRWITDGALVVTTRPFPKYAAAKDGADRAKMPAVAEAAEARFPALERSALPNGLGVLVARRASEIVRLDLLVRGGFAADGGSGTARLVGSLLTSGTQTRPASALRREIDRLGAEIEVDTQTDAARITLSAPRDALAAAVDLLADVALHPAFAPDEIEVQRRGQLAAIEQEHAEGRGIVQRVLPRLLFGDGHPHAAPGSGTGSADAVAKLTRDDLLRFHAAAFRPGSATLVVTGDVAPDALRPLLERGFGAWAPGAAAAVALPEAALPPKPRVFLIDRPGAPQSVIVAAQLMPPRRADDDLPLAVTNSILGGGFVSRLNMNLREDKHWSYGARTDVRDAAGQRVFAANAPVQTDKTAESLAEMVKEFRGIAGERPATAAEIAAAKSGMTLTLPGRWEAARAVAESVLEMVSFGLPDTYFDGYATRIRAVTPEQIAAAGRLVRPESLTWLVIGDRKKIEKGVRDLGVGEVTVIDADGRVVE
ncbi:MAG: insulinase family protein [Planctomycetes bacterium]|nr:insulinase family protein [Planctomycetota bacterium]